MSSKVGLVARPVTPRPRTSPWMKQVFPTPSSPVSATTAPGPRVRPRRSPASSVSSGRSLVISARGATQPPERLGDRRDDIARDQRLLPEALGGDVSGAPMQVHARLQGGLRIHAARQEGAEHAVSTSPVPPLAIPGL